ncbi:unnamed protein product [Brassica oleracea]
MPRSNQSINTIFMNDDHEKRRCREVDRERVFSGRCLSQGSLLYYTNSQYYLSLEITIVSRNRGIFPREDLGRKRGY